MNYAHYQLLEKVFLNAKINTRIFDSTTIQVSEGRAEITLQVIDDYFHGMDAMHGAVYFKLLDDAAFFAANSIVQDVLLLTTSFQIQFYRQVTKGEIKAVGELLHQSRNLFSAKAKLYDQRGKILGEGNGQFARSQIALNT
jgi:uncharacterized protein (TIGR00369 family)